MPSPRPLAVAVITHPTSGAIFVDEITEPGTGRTFHRAVGGGIEFGERVPDTLVRELREEYDLCIEVGARLGALENLYVYDGKPGHEIVVVHEARFTDPANYDRDQIACRDVEGIVGVWHPLAGSRYPLYPDGLDDLIAGR